MADSEVAVLTEDTAPAADDWLYKVNAAGTVDAKVSVTNLISTHAVALTGDQVAAGNKQFSGQTSFGDWAAGGGAIRKLKKVWSSAYTAEPELSYTDRIWMTSKGGGTVNQRRIASHTLVEDDSGIAEVAVSGAADNGSGLIRLTVASTSAFTTGDIVSVWGVGGTTEANDAWVVTVVDATHIDLVGSTFVNAYTSGGFASNKSMMTGQYVGIALRRDNFDRIYTGGAAHGDDVNGFVAYNEGTYGTDYTADAAFLVSGHSDFDGTKPAWYAGFNIETTVQYGLKFGGTAGTGKATVAGIDLSEAEMVGGVPAILLGNTHKISALKAGGTQAHLASLNASDQLVLGENSNVKVLTTGLSVDSASGGSMLSVTKDHASGAIAHLVTYGGTDANGSVLRFLRAKGSLASPAAVAAGSVIGGYRYWGYDGSSFVEGASIEVQAVTLWSGTNRESGFYFLATPSGSTTPALVLTIRNPTITVADAKDLKFGTTTGTKIGTTTTEKIGVYGATPIVQRSGAAQAAVATTSATNIAPWGFSTQAQADAIVTLVNELRAWAVAQGWIKGSA